MGRGDAEPHQIVRQPPVANQRSAGARQGRGGFDSVAALSRQPEKSGRTAVEADDGRCVGGEGSKTRPGSRDALNVQRGGALQALDARRHVNILGICIHGGTRRCIRGRNEQLSGVRFEIELLRDVGDHGPSPDIQPDRRGYVECGTPLRHQSESADAGSFRDAVGPRSRGVDQRRRAKCSRRRRHGPAFVFALDRLRFDVHRDARSPDLRSPKETLVQPMNVQFHGVRFDKCARNITLPQNRNSGDRSRNIHPGDGRHQGPRALEMLRQQLELVRSRDGDHAARR